MVLGCTTAFFSHSHFNVETTYQFHHLTVFTGLFGCQIANKRVGYTNVINKLSQCRRQVCARFGLHRINPRKASICY